MSDNKLDQAVFKIFRMTHEGKLRWVHKPAPAMWRRVDNSVYPIYFETHFQGRKLALYESWSKTGEREKYVKEFTGEPVNDWNNSIHLALLGDNDELMFEFPKSHQIQDMFKAVRYKEANVDEFLDQLLKSEPASEKE